MLATALHSSFLVSLSDNQRWEILSRLSSDEAEQLLYDWSFWARDKQLPPPGDWRFWLIRSGRGFGKTRTGAEWIRSRVESGHFGRIALVGQTKGDVRDTMVEVGDSSVMGISPPWFRPTYEPSKRRLTWPNGAIAMLYSGDEPDQLRGPQHDTAWVDELAKFKYPKQTMDNLEFGLRIGSNPQGVITTTPRPIPVIRRLIDDPDVIDIKGSSYENLANLAPIFLKRVLQQYEGTHLGFQELHGEVMDDQPGALWNRQLLEDTRVMDVPNMTRIVIGVDPQASSVAEGAGTGIVAAGVGRDGHGYVLGDYTLSDTPGGWASQAISAYNREVADRIVAEVNNGGEMVMHTIHSVDKSVPVKMVRASRGKLTRAEPVAAFYEQNRVHHVGTLGQLEDELCNWVPGEGDSPHRLDALVWAITELMIGARELEAGPSPTAGYRG